jgi:hypothetical protein
MPTSNFYIDYGKHMIMTLWKVVHYANENYANHDETSFEITKHYNYLNNPFSHSETSFEVTNIVMDDATIQIAMIVAMKQVLKSPTL